jgi:decaprenyl-phosphate phosphoribosyltransferase
MKKYLYLMRVHHYIKNILIFMPLIFSGNLTDRRKFMATLLGMIAFSLIPACFLFLTF